MVYYTTDTSSRRSIYFAAALLSVLISYALSFVQSITVCRLVAPSALMIFGGLLWIFDRFLWRQSVFHKFTGIPDFNGRWTGHLTRKLIHDGKTTEEQAAVDLVISQTWSKIELILESETTRSVAQTAALFIENPTRLRLLWIYSVRSRTALEADNYYGEGVTELVFYPKERTLEGTYFSSKLRKGHLLLKQCKSLTSSNIVPQGPAQLSVRQNTPNETHVQEPNK